MTTAKNQEKATTSGAGNDAARVLRATLIGGTAVLMWATLALFTALSGAVPPFLMVGLTFTIASVLMLGKWLIEGGSIAARLRLPGQVWALGVIGLFGYHFFYFLALRNAPPVEAGLIAYLWPLLIVVFSAFLPGEQLRWFHVAGVLMGLAGTFLLITGGKGLVFRSDYTLGYLAAAVCAVTWSTYSVVSRRFGQIPSDSIGGFCAVTAMLGYVSHLLLETTVWPSGWEWAAILALGFGPVGIAFFTWDHGVKHGDIRALGAFSYAAPLLSTLILIAFGQGKLTWAVAVACLLITGGAVLAAKALFRRRGQG